ncbi:RagB/SusD family nutrient uptake outer membrane protein [Algoriphagus sp. D3-2-R+10]|uniref:RagB/SusD family nutrient uptake outer membrane protein n=1 Tax=Algoriphagus aurantiacus TaxID=3103948 RepID=UPI002B3C2089|nr:RagB/SusD family nutrient uptake outer membrane protein [Algoriphagus sp. D3-2-R+10]MEB2777323.1 RagB/SusD family nutrient uptake outer membrane protein [Algoriphagus sp. D3-2-R+10]
MKAIKNKFLLLIAALGLISCEGFLDEKPEKSILVPQTVEDVRALLDYYTNLNDNALADFIMADDWVTEDANWESLSPWEQNAYLWKQQVFEPSERSTDYTKLYRKIFTANVSLEVLEGLGTGTEVRNLRGEALFIRALAYFQLAQLFLPSPMLGGEEIKLPVKLNPNVNEPSQWWPVSKVVMQVEQDLAEAFELVGSSSQFKNRPDKQVVKAVLARLYLYEERWEDALNAANYVLEQGTVSLLDYHEMDSTAAYPFSLFNSEVMYYGITSSFSVTASSATYINPDLMGKYEQGDLRRSLFFTESGEKFLFKGSYNGDYNLFTGISLPEMYLSGAEALVRMDRVREGLDLMAILAEKRYQSMDFWEGNLSKNPLDLVLEERQKELVFRGTRWMDMKRLHALGELDDVPTREIADQNYQLTGSDKLYLILPSYELELENN